MNSSKNTDLWRRFLARLIDTGIFLVFFGVCLLTVGIPITSSLNPELSVKNREFTEKLVTEVERAEEGKFYETLQKGSSCEYESKDLKDLCEKNLEFQKRVFQTSVLISGTISILYFTLSPLTKWQGTLGKKILGIRIVSTDKSKLSFLQAFTREILWNTQIVAFMFSVFWPFFGNVQTVILYFLLGNFSFLPLSRNQYMLYDTLSQTQVVQVPKKKSTPRSEII